MHVFVGYGVVLVAFWLIVRSGEVHSPNSLGATCYRIDGRDEKGWMCDRQAGWRFATHTQTIHQPHPDQAQTSPPLRPSPLRAPRAPPTPPTDLELVIPLAPGGYCLEGWCVVWGCLSFVVEWSGGGLGMACVCQLGGGGGLCMFLLVMGLFLLPFG